MRRRFATATFAVLLIGGLVGSASAAGASVPPKMDAYGEDGAVGARQSNGSPDGQHGTLDGHLPGQQRNVERVGRLLLTDRESGIADIAYFKKTAYLNKWHPHCGAAGTEVVDVSDPAHPRKIAFLPAGEHDYTTEGAHAFRMNTPFFTGDVYVVSHESCDDSGKGGISLWDVSDPSNPWPIRRHFGDETLGGNVFAHDSHSAMGYNFGGKSYVVAVDNFQQGTGDIDIFDVTNPYAPVHKSSFGLPSEAAGGLANGAQVNHHDMWVRNYDHDGDGTKSPMLMVSYWDAGWILFDVTNPEEPVYVDDSDYNNPDPEAAEAGLGNFTAEGNAHQGEWSSDGKYWLGTDEDFGPSRIQFTTNDEGEGYSGGEFSWTVPIADEYEDEKLNGTVVWGGTGCPTDVDGDGTADRDQVPDAADYDAEYGEGEERILVLTRGSCFFSEKVESAELAGWDAAIVGNHHNGTLGGLNPDAYLCGSLGHEYTPTINGLCIGHDGMHGLFDDAGDYSNSPENAPPPGQPGDFIADMPAIGTVGDEISASSTFDGWGYLQQLDADTLEQVDTFAPPKVHDPDCASGCGTMSIHEIATDKRSGVNLGYVAWYTLGMRVVKWSEDGLKQKGVYMDNGGQDFWGVEVWNRGKDKRPLILMSDRDSGLWILKYTGGADPAAP